MNAIKFYDLEKIKTKKGGNTKLDGNVVQIYCRGFDKNTSPNYCLFFPFNLPAIADGYKRINFAKNDLTGEVFILFSKTDGFLLTHGNKTKTHNVCSKGIVTLFMDLIGLEYQDINTIYNLSEDLGSNNETIVYKVFFKN